jgi:uncharacterized protein (DUF433 family)
MSNIAPLVNTRGPLFVHSKGIVKRTTFHTMAMYANLLNSRVAAAEVKSEALEHNGQSIPAVDAIVRSARILKLSWPQVLLELSDLAEQFPEDFGEAMDTAVREAVYIKLGFDTDFYVLCHELVHASGANSRLNRFERLKIFVNKPTADSVFEIGSIQAGGSYIPPEWLSMDENKLLERITVNPKIFKEKPIIRGRRLAVERVLRMLAAGDTPETILKGYPWLEMEAAPLAHAFGNKPDGTTIH